MSTTPRPRFRSPTPRARGFTMPAEWERHEATWLAWPHDETTWDGCLEEAEEAVCAFAAALATGETVHMLVRDREVEARASFMLNAAGARRVALHRIPTVDSWFRDYGPIVVAKGRGASRERVAIDFRFNAWGEKYPELMADDRIPGRLRGIHGLSTLKTSFVLEGGSIEVNGRGTLLTTEQCLLNTNRNPEFNQAEIERHLRELLGVRHILWLGRGIEGDDTDGHIDDIARFVNPTTVVAVAPSSARHADAKALNDNLRRLRSMADQDGEPLKIVPLPSPKPVRWKRKRLPASYANFYIGNRVVCVPTFRDPADRAVLRTFRGLFPKRKVIGIDCRHLVAGLGALHCISQQLPS